MINLSYKNKKNYAIYVLGFLFSIQVAFPAYINSTFLNQYASEKFVGILYAVGSIITIFILAVIPYFLRKFKNYRVILTLSIAEVILLIGLAIFKTIFLLAPIFIVILVIINIIYFNLDIFLENNTNDDQTGSIRGSYLTTMNIAWVISPMLAGLLLVNGGYWKIYIISAMFMAIFAGMLIYFFRNFEDTVYDRVPFWNTFSQVWKNKNIHKIFISNFILKFFYSWMVIYTPIYLHKTIGFNWSEIGVMFTIMLLPFILLEIPIGKLADSKWGEKEFLSIGFIIMALSTGALTFITGSNFILWTSVLFLARVGASMVEIMTETYFFKQINDSDANILGFFRNTRPLAYIIAPIIAFIFLSFFDQKYLFLVLGVIIFMGLKYSLTLKDTL